ncbi:MoaD/ThiS family protein [Methanosarcina sp.]|uniref:MoaD/ThiS family protein n=1 Tax=Methanosarcina sp. TaxID=2213 RepID=UPI00298984C7|nr:MoaD/ThiS family protein [Methanosarcina sp.]MDW5550700.1 MoaD/ThiS family protein [Methanosarcina sp.]MDW5552463.1 MoaD/ThiS family protein [Methanosarcina sp.]MDW5560194.1 MoaD/ThiS family protein [Methanosarcina sp.]
MKIRIKTFAQIKDILGADSFLECQDDSSMMEFLKALRERAGKSEDQLFSRDGYLHSNLVLILNGARIYEEEIDSLKLSEGDEITLFSPVSGG